MFTIEVRKKEKDEDFTFRDLEMFHKECIRGRINQIPLEHNPRNVDDQYSNGWVLTCQRCGASIYIEARPKFQAAQVIATAIDGEERKITDDITVIQKS